MNPDHLDEVVYLYERLGHFDNIVELLEQGLGAEQAHTGIYTELGCLYSKYRPEKLMEHIKIFWSRCTIPKLLRACEAGHHHLCTIVPPRAGRNSHRPHALHRLHVPCHP